MTDDEKTIVKGMNNIISGLTVQKALYESVLKRHLANWQEEVEAAKASEPLQDFARRVEEMRQGIDLLIEQNNLTIVRTRLAKEGLAN